MALAQPNYQGPQSSGIGSPQVSEAQPSLLLLDISVLRAHNLPRLKTFLGKKRQFYVTVTNGATTWQSQFVRSVGQRVEWNESVDTFAVHQLSRITVSLYARNTVREDILIGKQEIACEAQCELRIDLRNGDVHDECLMEPPTLFLTITVSTNPSSSPAVSDNTPHATITNPTTVMAPPPSSQRGDIPTEGDTSVPPMVDNQMEMPRMALRQTKEALDTMETWSVAVDVIKRVMDAVSPIAALHPYAGLAWSLLSMIPETLLLQVQRDDNVRTLFKAICDAFEFASDAEILKNIDPKSLQAKILEDMLQRVSEISKFIELYAKNGQAGKRTLKNIRGQVDGKIEQYRAILVQLRDEFLARAAVTTEVTVLRMQDGVSKIQDDLRAISSQASEVELVVLIRELPYKGGWRFGDEKRCLPGTRKDFLDHIIAWVENPESERGLVLLGQAGTGKSSIAHEVARHFENKYLGSYFAFLRKEDSKDEVYQVFTTLARDLSDRYPAFKLALGRVIKNNSFLSGTRDRRTLFERLLLEPLKSLKLRDPLLVVIDALDESGDAMGRNGLHRFLAQRLLDLPSKFRVLITSRPEDGIEDAFANALSVSTLYMDDSKLAAKTEQDICLYLQNELPPDIFKDHGIKLAKAAEGLFQWTAVASGLINSPPASFGFSKRKCVQRLLGLSQVSNGQDPLDKLYEEVLEGYFKPLEAQLLFRSVMGQLFAAIKPLSLQTLIALRRHAPIDDAEDSEPVVEMLRHLGSLLSNVTSSDGSRPIVPLHTSFRDFLTNKKNDAFYVDLADARRQLAHSCLGLMLEDLKFNICKLESSYLANSDVPDLESRIAKYISPSLSYACVYWDDHLEHLAFEHDLFIKLRSIFETKLLFWLEVLSIISSVGLAIPALSSLKNWLWSDQWTASPTEVENLFALVHDTSAFVRYFGTAIARSAPHIYISALPFTPHSSHILKHYGHIFPHTLSLKRGQLSHWPPLEMVIQAHNGSVESVAFSRDGQRIASASRDCTIRVWDATTGEVVAGPFSGHTEPVITVAFSPDGQRIASASGDHTIRVWDAATGEVLVGPLAEHASVVFCVAFSPDGQHIASASADFTIRVWDATTGGEIIGPFTGHTDAVRSVAFSPDGRRIASASFDRTIRVWDASTGDIVAGPFTGHTGLVYSAVFSPDGQCIASASSDCTIRVWHAATGEVSGLFTGHSEEIFSIAFSPDGQRIVSTSRDLTIRVWDVATGAVVVGPFIGHTSSVYSVAFSPDGQRIASASYDRTIRLWDAAKGEVQVDTSTGHTADVKSIAFSPDGQRIASASGDRTVRVWDATTGEVIQRPFTGHTNSVVSVAFSPDGQRIASASRDRTVRVYDAETGEVLVGPLTGHNNSVYSVAFSPNGQRIASGSIDRTIRLWDAATGEAIASPLSGHTGPVASVAFSPVGENMASASYDHTVIVWNATTGEFIRPLIGHTDWVHCVAFSPDGQRLASASRDRTILVWDLTSERPIVGPFTGHTDSIKCVAFSPDGRRIVSAAGDYTIRVWDAATGHTIAGPLTAHTEVVFSVAFSPDGQHIASASGDGTICMWHATTRAVGVGPSIEPDNSVTSTPDTCCVASTSRDRTIHLEKVKTEDVEKIRLMDKFPINSDGWMCGEERELLLWIPKIHRPYLHGSNIVWVVGQHYTDLDLSNFVHGSNWAAVYHDVHDSSK